jgi:hypothetical protein
MGIACRCLTRTNGVKCTKRMTLLKYPSAYKVQPKCPFCGGRSWYVETYRIEIEYQHPAGVCYCNAYKWPHRKFTGRCSELKFASDYWSESFDIGHCEGCNLLAEDDFGSPVCQAVSGQEDAKYCAAVQEFKLEHGLKEK